MPKKQPKPGFSDVFSTQASAPTGKALDTLFADQRIDSAAERVVGDIGRSSTLLPVAALVPNPYQPRKAFDADELQSLADSIREEGVLERLLVRRSPTQAQVYEIAAGERRWRAAKLAGLKEVPCDILEECPDARMKRIGIIENVLRVGLKPLELAEAYRSLLEEHDEQERPVYTIRSLAEQLGLPKDNIDSHLALLRVQPEVRRLIEEDPSIPLRIIREIGGIESEEDRALLIGEVRSRSLNQPDVLAILQQARHGKRRKLKTADGEPEPGTSLILRAVLQRKLQREQQTFKRAMERIEGDWARLDPEGRQEVHAHLRQMVQDLTGLLERHPLEQA